MLDIIEVDNGLKIYLVNNLNKHSTYINLIVNFGGKDNEIILDRKKIKIKSGVAHFLEHLVLESNCYGDIMEILSSNGIRSNGFTSINRTQFFIDTVSENLEEELNTLLYGIHNPIINKDSINKVKGPIIAEKKRSLDNKYTNLYNKSVSNILKQGHFDSILGDLNDISSINQNDLKNAFNAYYRPNNEVIVIGGRFNKEKVIETIKKIYSSINFDNRVVKTIEYKNIYGINKKNTIIKEDINIEKSIISFKLPLNDLDPYNKILLDTYVYYFLRSNFGVTSKINNELVKNNIILGNIGFSSNIIDNSYIISIEAFVKNDTIFNDTILKYLLNKEFIFDENLFLLYKKNTIIDYIIRKDNIYKMIDPLIENIISFNYEKLDSINDIEKLSFKEYKNTISNLDFSTYSISILKRK